MRKTVHRIPVTHEVQSLERNLTTHTRRRDRRRRLQPLEFDVSDV